MRCILNLKYIQNRTNWCWVVACKMVGEQFKRNKIETTNEQQYENRVVTYNMDGLRKEVAEWDGKNFWIDSGQRAIVMNSYIDNILGDENVAGDDLAKERGIKYVVTGDCYSESIQVVTIGEFDVQDSLLSRYEEQMRAVFKRDGYMIGNAILFPKGICHSFVLLDWTEDNNILLYDPWDGSFDFYPVEAVFVNGFVSALGMGIVKWIQYIE